MSNEFEKEVCPICNNEECSCEKESKVAIKRNITINFDEKENTDCNCDCDCDCEGKCNCEDKKKTLAILGATVVAIGVAGGILYLVKNKK